MHIALLSDIHGNLIALDAVLADIARLGGVDAYWLLGDLVALGPDPVGVLERLSSLPNAHCIRGNTDRYVVTGDRPPPSQSEVQRQPELLPVLAEISGTFAWTQGMITAAGWFEWMAKLPLELREVLPDGTRCLGVHAAPGLDDGPGIPPDIQDLDLQMLVADCEADLVCVGHTHWPLDRRANGRRVINLGSISNPLPPDLRASYVLIHADSAGYQVDHRRVAYDREAVVAELYRLGHPGARFIVKHLRGEQPARWGANDYPLPGA
jgi:predicted phosphodiesterase